MITWLMWLRGVHVLGPTILWCGVYLAAITVAGAVAHARWHWLVLRFVTWFGLGATVTNLTLALWRLGTKSR